MKKGFLLLAVAIAGILSIAASQLVDRDAGARSVPSSDRLSITEPRYSGQWKGNDLTVEYSYSRDRGKMDLSGNIRFADFMVLGYSNLLYFHLGAVFVDASGRVVQEIGLATSRDSFDSVPFHQIINLPSNAVSMAFTYEGKAAEGSDDGSGLTSFWHYPIR